MTKTDRLALELALEQIRMEPGHAEQIDQMLTTQSWGDVAEFAAYYRQMETLNLKPWQLPPCWITDPNDADSGQPPAEPGPQYDGRQEAARLLRQMLDAGVSRWHPDPVKAIEATKRGAT